MKAIVIPCAVLAAMAAGECRAVDWEINLESNLSPNMGLDRDGYRWDLVRDRSRSYFAESQDLLKAEALIRPSDAGQIDWEIAVAAALRPGARMDDFDQRRRRGGLGDYDGSLTIRATIRPRSSRAVR